MAGGIKDNFNKTGNKATPKKVRSKKAKLVSPRTIKTQNAKQAKVVKLPKLPTEPDIKAKKTTKEPGLNLTYDRAAVKRANERLRKMEKDPRFTYHGRQLSEYNSAYQARKHDFEMNEKSGGSIFKRDKTGLGIRYISEKEFNQLSRADQERFIKNLYNWLEADSSKKGTFMKAIHNNYNTMDEHYDLAEKGISEDDWLEVLRVYHTKVVPNDNSHYGSKVIIDAIDNLDIPNMSARDLEKAMQYIVAGRQDKIPREWWQETY